MLLKRTVLLLYLLVFYSCILERKTAITENPNAPIRQIYVQAGANEGIADGSSSYPFPTISRGLSAAAQKNYNRVYIMSGVYYENINLSGTPVMELVGDGSSTVLRGNPNDPSNPVITNGDSSNRVMISNITISPINPLSTFMRIGAYAPIVTLDSIIFEKNSETMARALEILYSATIGASDNSTIIVQNSTFRGFTESVYFEPRSSLALINNYFEIPDAGTGLALSMTDYSYSKFYLSKNRFYLSGSGTSSYGIQMSAPLVPVGSMLLEGNSFYGNPSYRKGIGIGNSSTSMAASNIMFRTHADGTRNSFRDLDYGMFFRNAGDLNLQVSDTLFTSIRDITVVASSAIHIEDSLNLMLTVDSSTFGSSSSTGDNCLNGVHVMYNGTNFPRNSNINISNNSFYYTGYGAGAGTSSGSSIFLNLYGATVTLNNNNIQNQYGNAIEVNTFDGGVDYREADLYINGGIINNVYISNAIGGNGIVINASGTSVLTNVSINNIISRNTNISGLNFTGNCITGGICQIGNSTFTNNGSSTYGGSGIAFTYTGTISSDFIIYNNTINNAWNNGILLDNQSTTNAIRLHYNTINTVNNIAGGGIHISNIATATIAGTTLIELWQNSISATLTSNILFDTIIPGPSNVTMGSNHFGTYTSYDIYYPAAAAITTELTCGANNDLIRAGNIVCATLPYLTGFCGCL